MNISIIRHAKVNYKWNKWSSSDQFNEDCHQYDIADIESISSINENVSVRIYTSMLSRSIETAKELFGESNFTKTELLNEVPLRAAFKTGLCFPLNFWNLIGRIQWFVNNKNQPEGRRTTYIRAQSLVKLLMEREEDSILVTHGFFMITLIKVLKKNGFIIDKNPLHFKNCQTVEAKLQDNVSRET